MRKKMLLALALLCAAPTARADILVPGAPNITAASLLTTKSFLSGYPGQFLQPGNNGGIVLTMDGAANYFALINTINTNNTGGYSAGYGDFWDMFIVVYNAQQEVSAFASNGSFSTAAYINANGHYYQNTPPYINWILPSSDPSMFACNSDVTGPCMQTRNNAGAAGERNFDALDWQGKYSFSIDGNNHQLLMGRSSTYAAMDTFLAWPAAATLQFGGADAASPIAQTISFQNVLAGTSNAAGADTYFKASAGTGTGVGGKFHFQTALAGSTGSTQNAVADDMAIGGGVTILRGGNSVPQLSFAPNSGQGFGLGMANSGSVLDIFGYSSGYSGSAVQIAGFNGNGLILNPNTGVQWTNLGGNVNTTIATSLSWIANGTLAIGTGSIGSFAGSLKLTSEIYAPLTYATLPASPSTGQRAYITDGNTTTYYATVSSGGGSSKISVLYNGSNWVVD